MSKLGVAYAIKKKNRKKMAQMPEPFTGEDRRMRAASDDAIKSEVFANGGAVESQDRMQGKTTEASRLDNGFGKVILKAEGGAVKKPTIHEALTKKLGREPSHAEVKSDVKRILDDAAVDRATAGKMPHQRKYAEGGEVEAMKRQRLQPIKEPRMVESKLRISKSDPYAEGGRVHKGATEESHGPTDEVGYKNRNKSSDMDHGSKKGPEGYSKYQEQAQNQKGVHTPVSGVTGFPGGKGSSEAGKMATETYAGKPHRELRDHGKDLHKKKLEEMRAMPAPKLKGLAEGGMVEDEAEQEQHASVAAAIMAKREREMFADGGMVDIDENAEEMPNEFDELNEAALKENYDSDMDDVSQPMDSNEHGHELSDEDESNMSKIERIMARMRKRSPITR